MLKKEYISEIQVMKSAAGYYVGHSYTDPELGFPEPYDRKSDYFKSEAEAKKYLEEYKLAEAE